mgnify:CR=1 FL=1
MNYRSFTIKGHFDVDIDDVLAFLDIDDEDYEPTDDEWLACAKEMFENDEFNWIDSTVTED